MNQCATSVVRHTATIPNLETNKKINKNVNVSFIKEKNNEKNQTGEMKQ